MGAESDGPLGSAAALRIIGLLEKELDADGWRAGLAEMERESGLGCYSVLLFVLTHLDFTASTAKDHWGRILEQWKDLEASVPDGVDLRVAVLHYFLRIQKRLENPAIVEIRILRQNQNAMVLDDLTRLRNFRYFQERIREEVKRLQRYETPLSLLMVDADDFKNYNDTRGHLAGNVALRALARVLERNVRDVDIVTRYGGEEFAILLPNTPKLGAIQVAEKVRRGVEQAGIGREGNPAARPLTVSIGVATAPVDSVEADGLVQKADSALYVAKSLGKNRVQSFSDERRESTRTEAAVVGWFNPLAKEAHALTTQNLSEGGILFTSTEPVPVGSMVQVRFNLPSVPEPVECIVRVARVTERLGGYEVGARIVDIGRLDRRRFRGFLARLRAQDTEAEAPAG